MIYWDEIWEEEDSNWSLFGGPPERKLTMWEAEAMRQYARDWLNGDTSRYESRDFPPLKHSVVTQEVVLERSAYAAMKAKKGN